METMATMDEPKPSYPTIEWTSIEATGTVLHSGTSLVLVPSGPARPDHHLALQLQGDDLPPEDAHVVVQGELTGRTLLVRGWRPESLDTSAWGRKNRFMDGGTDRETAHRVSRSIPKDWPIISVGGASTRSDNLIVTLHVEQLTPEIFDWLAAQPAGSVEVFTFIRPLVAADR